MNHDTEFQMSNELDKGYEPATVEARWYKQWEEHGAFTADAHDTTKKPFCLVYPPTNVTGTLHMGHALTVAIQDTIIRWRRMCGDNVLWLPGTDHAGIATQMVVERQLGADNITRHDLGREKFLDKVWEWKEKRTMQPKAQAKNAAKAMTNLVWRCICG